jgi:hypothetical protein
MATFLFVPLSSSRAPPLRSFGQWLIAVASALGCIALFAPPATAATLTPSPDPLPGSTFQGADGNQDNAAPNIDWQARQASRRVLHNPDPNARDIAFKAGAKEDEPGQWEFTTEAGGVNPGRANILDAWSSVDPGGAQAFLYLSFTRQSQQLTRVATTFLSFELNHDSRLWTNGAGASIPCRRTGDLLISYEAHGGVDVVIQRWVTSTTDPATGCATTGQLDLLTGLSPEDDVQGAVNAEQITARLPGFYDDDVPAFHFGEAALNLNEILEGARVDPCVSFGSIWMHSRSSTSEFSNMQDYVAPHALTVRTCAASGTKFHDRNASGRRDEREPGLPRWTIWADYNNDGIRDANEPFGMTDSQGRYVINDIRPPGGTYRLREALPTSAARRRAARAFVRCSYPTTSAPGGMFPCAWGPISTAETTYARRRDFGNYESAQLVVRKELEPSSDPGRFDLLVNRRVVVAAAGDAASRMVAVGPGMYTVSEAAVAGTNPADYRSSVDCKRETRRTQRRAGGVYESLQLSSGERVVCTFRNVRLGSPRDRHRQGRTGERRGGRDVALHPRRHEPGRPAVPRRLGPGQGSDVRRPPAARQQSERGRCGHLPEDARSRRHLDLCILTEDHGGKRLPADGRAEHGDGHRYDGRILSDR